MDAIVYVEGEDCPYCQGTGKQLRWESVPACTTASGPEAVKGRNVTMTKRVELSKEDIETIEWALDCYRGNNNLEQEKSDRVDALLDRLRALIWLPPPAPTNRSGDAPLVAQ